jgi:hypothetical protein
MTEFSDPAWWPKPPPKPPKAIPLTKILFGTLLPLVVALGVGIWIFTRHGAPTPVLRAQSIALFESCMQAHGSPVGRGGGSAAAFQACADRLPPGTQLNGLTQESASQEQEQHVYEQCMQSATANISHGPRGFSRGGSALQTASDLCRSLVQGSLARPGTPGEPRRQTPS